MTTDEILFIINRHIKSSNKTGAAALEKVKSEIETQVKTELEQENKPTGKCKICRKESNRLQQGLYCMDCFDRYID